jgi:serine/threonine-protein kinase
MHDLTTSSFPQLGSPLNVKAVAPNAANANTAAPVAAGHDGMVIPTFEELNGKILGQYKILSEIGQGGAGKVFLAWHQHLHRHCAIKILFPHANSSPMELFSQLQQEGQSAANLIHPYIVTTHFLGQENGYHFLEMEFVPGGSLSQYLQDHGPVSPLKALIWAGQMARALGHAHSRGILHRDLKPSNVLLTTDMQVKVADFGLAIKPIANTSAKEIAGTVGYIAPELLLNQPATPAADIYSLGMTLYVLLTCYQPGKEISLDDFYLRGGFDPLPNLRDLCPDVPLDVASLINEMLSPSAQERPAHGMAAAMLIDNILGKARDLDSLVNESLNLFPNMTWHKTATGYDVDVQLPQNRKQKVVIEASDSLKKQSIVMIYSLCCKDDPQYHTPALRLNSQLSHGGIALKMIDDTEYFVMQNSYPRGTVDPEEIRESVLEVAYNADMVEKLLTGRDEH